MATRFYLQYGTTPAVTPASWEPFWTYVAATNDTFKAVTTAGITILTNLTHTNDGTSGVRYGARVRFVTEQLAAQTLSGNVSGQIQCSESATGNNAVIAIALVVIDSSGTIVGDLLNAGAPAASATPPEMATTLTNRRILDGASSASIAFDSYACANGDRLVIEIGLREATTAGTEVIRVGDDALSGDLPVNDTTTATTYRPWVEFDSTILFYTPSAVSVIKRSAMGYGKYSSSP